MKLTEIDYPDTQPIDGYGPGFFRVGGEVIRGGLLVLPKLCRAWAGFDDLDALLEQADQIDVLFLGTGAELTHLPPHMRQQLEDAGIGVETMASPSACRTFNVLLSEGRRVGLAALPVGEPT